MNQSLRNVALALAIALLAMACGGEDQASAPPEAESAGAPPSPMPQPDAEPADRSVPTIAEHLRGGTDSLPDDYPDDAPVYPRSTPSRVREVPGNGLSVMFRSEDSPKAVHDFMTEFLPGQGWEVTTDQPLRSGYVLQGEKGDRRINIVASYVDPGTPTETTMIAVTVIK